MLKELCDKVADKKTADIQFDDLKKLKYLSKEAEIPVLDFLLKRQTIYQINNDNKPKYSITEDEFVDLFSGSQLYDVLYKYPIDEQRLYVEDLSQLYTILGGDEEGIDNEKLKENIEKYITDNNLGMDATQECREIFDLLASKDDVITLEDFVNMMTCQTPESKD